MHHIAFLKKSWRLIPKILSGDKTIETRWYMAKFSPWDRIKPGDNVYFKNSGEPITAMAEVEKVEQAAEFSDAWLENAVYGLWWKGGISFVSPLDEVFEWAKRRKYAILVFLKNPRPVEPFDIDKTGFGNACAWITVDDIAKIKKIPE